MRNSDEMVTIAAVSSTQADLIRMYLEVEGVPVFLHGEFIGTAAPHVAAPAGAGAVRVQVPKSREQEARKLISAWEKR